MTSFSHAPVLAREVVELLAPQSGAVICDATVGGGGHAAALLEASAPDGSLIGIDRDAAAIEAARARLQPFGARVTLVQGRFGEVAEILRRLGAPPLSALVADLGVSSHQLDTAERGFSFSRPGPIDMRMDPSEGETALELIARLEEAELAEIIAGLGEERYPRRVARVLKERQAAGDLATTTDLARAIRDAMPAAAFRHRDSKLDPATRTFQALRIAVNQELEELARFLEVFPGLLAPRGRCAVISFHSLEDRRVKERFRDLEWTSRLPDDLAAAAGERTVPVCRTLTRKPITASEEEMARNPRARSAKLRVAEKVAEGAPRA